LGIQHSDLARLCRYVGKVLRQHRRTLAMLDTAGEGMDAHTRILDDGFATLDLWVVDDPLVA
jgi:hypothetical protein